MDRQATLREGQVLRIPLTSADAVFEQEFTKGEAAGIRLVLGMPKQMIDSIQADIDLMEGTQNADQETSHKAP